MAYLMALDQGTSSCRAIIFDEQAQIKALAQREIDIQTPQSGWVEQDANQIWQTQIAVMQQALAKANLYAKDIAAIGLTNQRETTVLWDKRTGEPVLPAIVWQDRRASEWCQQLKEQGLEEKIQQKTGLRLDPYFSAGKLVWALQHHAEIKALADRGHLAFGTIDSWLIWKLSAGERHVIEVSNASRTLLMNLATQQWDDELLELFAIPKSILPEIVLSQGVITHTATDLLASKIPIAGVLGDQQAALFGQGCFSEGMAKNTYGTGCFMLMNTGQDIQYSQHQLLSTLAWQTPQHNYFALEGSVFMAGAIVQWLRDNLGIIRRSEDIERLANQVDDNGGVTMVPAFTGLAAPHWDSDARALICGLSRGSNKSHIARAALESIAFQVYDVLDAMQKDSPHALTELRVDGGASQNNMLMQFQADLLGVPVLRPKLLESTAWGAAMMAGLAVNYFNSEKELADLWQLDRCFEPSMSQDERQARLQQWHLAVKRTRLQG
ncbi:MULTISPECIES: glycerol kinase GlpK [unclassified Acinetobacter]|uniref:glycerol kinase GlpK n=1 Tax=unclassified Acinetobacter TaxID=196816 RepID=UPI0035B6D99E